MSREYHEGTRNGADERLSALLRQDPAIEPQAAFEANVWRRIRSETATSPIGWWQTMWDWFLPHPVWAAAATVSVSLFLGALAGVAMPGRGRTGPAGNHALLSPWTLAGTYLTVSEGGRQ